MLGFKFVKATPNTYLIQVRNGKTVREGTGLAFWYYAPRSSLVSIPLNSMDLPFMLREVTSDFQEVSVQGQVTFKVTDPALLAAQMNFTLKPDGNYIAEDPAKLPGRVANAVQVNLHSALQALTMSEALQSTDRIVVSVRQSLKATDVLAALGVAVLDLSILAIKPNPDTARALEAPVREQILKRADDATYERRNSAIEQERTVKENELKTDIAVEQKKRQIKENQVETERTILEKRQQMQQQEMTGKIKLEEQNKSLVELATENQKREADVKSYALNAVITAIKQLDAKSLQALSIGSIDPSTLMALAFQGLAENAAKIGELNIAPDLLKQIATRKAA